VLLSSTLSTCMGGKPVSGPWEHIRKCPPWKGWPCQFDWKVLCKVLYEFSKAVWLSDTFTLYTEMSVFKIRKF
jgi:hypothetical protein